MTRIARAIFDNFELKTLPIGLFEEKRAVLKLLNLSAEPWLNEGLRN